MADEFRLGDLRGKKLFAKKPVKLYRPGSSAPFRTISRGGYIGRMTDWKLDTSKVKAFDPTLKTLKTVKFLIFFSDKKGPYYMQFINGADQLDFDAIKRQGVKTEEQYKQETQEAAAKSPFESAAGAAGDLLKKYWPLIAAGLVTVILIKKT